MSIVIFSFAVGILMFLFETLIPNLVEALTPRRHYSLKDRRRHKRLISIW